MKKFKKCIGIALACSMAISLAACGGGSSSSSGGSSGASSGGASSAAPSGEVKTLIAAHTLDTTHHVHQGFVKMDEVLQDISGGTMKLDIYPSSALGDEEPVLETQSLGGGTIDLSSPSGNALQPFSSEFLTVDFPFVFENYDQVWKFYDGEFGQYLFDSLEGTGLKGIAWWDNGFRNLTTTNKEIHTADDLKGMKIRTMSARVHMANFNALGAAATPVPFAELYSALQQGVADGQENPIANIYGNRLYEVQKYIMRTRHVHDPQPVLMSQDSWDGLTEEQQGWVMQAVEEATQYMRKLSADEEEEKLQKLQDNGMVLVELTPEEHQTFVDKTKDVYKEFESEITPEGLELYFKAVEEAKK